MIKTMIKWVLSLLLVLSAVGNTSAQVTVPHVFSTSVPVSQLNTNLSTLGAGALNRAGGTITGNITVNSGVTIDGVDISAVLAGTGTPTFSSVTISGTGASALDVAGGINAGSGNVGIVDSTGKIPALSSTYFASLSGANLTGLTFSQLPMTWTSRVYASGNFSANGSMTWTVDAGDVAFETYVQLNKTYIYSFYVVNTTVGGTANNILRITLPNSATVGSTPSGGACTAYDSLGVGDISVHWRAQSGSTYLEIIHAFGSNWALSTNAVSISCQAVYEVV